MTDRFRKPGCSGVFVTGTDTGVGKTRVSLGLMAALQRQNLSVVGMKPVSAGCERTPGGLRNEDALLLQRQASVTPPYERVNPVAFEPPIAPHIAAAETGTRIDFARIERAFSRLAACADLCVVEGAGGWLVPLSSRRSFADLAERLALPVLLVVAIRLGCLNHALLTAESIERHGLPLMGWVANLLTPDIPRASENIDALDARIPAPRLATVDFTPNPTVAHFERAFSGPTARDPLKRIMPR
ncbi:MAG TPA: dethiobiotin synthase [Gammaproteobacteria bacterium]|nr:dethiobiotin synthase [Gammaproteobacteria bacterium]